MKSTRFSGLPSFDSSFSKHRSHLYPKKFALELSLSKTTPAPNWAPLPSPPMSGSPSPEDPPEPPQVAGRRRKRSTTPPPGTTGTTGTTAASQTPTEQDPSRRRATQQSGALELATTAVPAPSYPSSHPSAQSFGYGPSGPSIIHSGANTLETQLGSGDVAPRASRKTKAHVASACVNCKKKHLRCDNARPCRRCVQSGKEASCIDVEHKKRGRPPLKPEENQPRRSFESAMSPLQGHLAGFSRLPAAQSSSYPGQQPARDLRPVPSGRESEVGRPVFPRPTPPYQAIYAQPTVSPSPATATGTMSRHAQGGLAGYSQAQTTYSMTQTGGMTTIGPENFSHYAGSYSYISSQQTAPYSLFPRTSSQMQSSEQPTSRPGYGHMLGMPSDLRLPPIQPAPPGGVIDPAMAQQQRQVQHQSQAEQPSGNGTTRQPNPKRPKFSNILRND